MSERKRQDYLLFSASGTAVQALCGLFIAALLGWGVYEFAFRVEDIPTQARRHQWLTDLMLSGGGATGAVLLGLLALICCWWLWEAARRFFTDDEAATLTDAGLKLHSSFRRKAEIPFEDVLSATVRPSYLGRLPGKSHYLEIYFRGRRRIQIKSLIADGGTEALRAFARELNARRERGGGSSGAATPRG